MSNRKDNVIFAKKSMLTMEYQQILENIYQAIQPYAKDG